MLTGCELGRHGDGFGARAEEYLVADGQGLLKVVLVGLVDISNGSLNSSALWDRCPAPTTPAVWPPHSGGCIASGIGAGWCGRLPVNPR